MQRIALRSFRHLRTIRFHAAEPFAFAVVF
jgi:hypothetical protein